MQVLSGQENGEYLAEVPLIAMMFLVMVWHGRRRLEAMAEMQQVVVENLRLLEQQRRFLARRLTRAGHADHLALGHTELIERAVADRMVAEDARVVEDELLRLRRLATSRMLLLASAGSADFLHLAPIGIDSCWSMPWAGGVTRLGCGSKGPWTRRPCWATPTAWQWLWTR